MSRRSIADALRGRHAGTATLLLALLACAGCRGDRPADTATAPHGAAPAGAAAAPTVPESGLVSYLPPPAGPPSGWARTKPAQTYGVDNLWEFIDGAAETYVSFGFEEALSAGYSSGGADVGVEIYRMADSLHAYGIYMQELSSGVEFVALGAEGYTKSNVVNFWKGACYVKLIAARPDRPGTTALTAFARAVADRIAEDAPMPRELAAFPSAGLVPHSVKFLPKDVLGQSYFANGFEASYQIGETRHRIVAMTLASPTEAISAFRRYRAFVGGGGVLRPASPTVGDEGFSGDDKFSGRVFAARAGSQIVIALGASTDAAGSAAVATYLKHK